MNQILVDTSVLIQIWRNPEAQPLVLYQAMVSVNTVSYIEFFQGANRRQKKDAVKLLRRFNHIRLDSDTSDIAIDLIDKHSESDGLRLADALIAATCLVHKLRLLTLNQRHFKNIRDLQLV